MLCRCAVCMYVITNYAVNSTSTCVRNRIYVGTVVNSRKVCIGRIHTPSHGVQY